MKKKCYNCNKTKDASEFDKHVRRVDGLSPKCLDCIALHNKEQIRIRRIQARESYQANLKYNTDRSYKYYHANRSTVLAKARVSREENSDKIAARNRSLVGISRKFFYTQCRISKTKNLPKPDYDYNYLHNWLMTSTEYKRLHSDWVASDYDKDLEPYLVRIDHTEPFRKGNLTINTWGHRREYGYRANAIAVKATPIEGDGPSLYFNSAASAGREMQRRGLTKSANAGTTISASCRGIPKTYLGFDWHTVKQGE